MLEQERLYVVTPFYAAPKDPHYSERVSALKETVRSLLNQGFGEHQIITVSDGARLEDILGYVTLATTRSGKALAIKTALNLIEFDIYGKVPREKVFVLQLDADKDQDPRDLALFLQYFQKEGIKGDQPALVIGDRYLQGQAEENEHRQAMLALQSAFSKGLGYDVRDPVFRE